MNLKKDNALAGIDMIIAIVVVMIFSVLILTLITNNALENVKNAKETMAMIYITEIFENIGMAEYDTVSKENANTFISQEILNNYDVEMRVEDTFEKIENKDQDILKKVYLTLTYEIGNKVYSCSMERLKIRE